MTRQLNERRHRIVDVQEIIFHGSGWPADEIWRIRPSDDGSELLTEFKPSGGSFEERDAVIG